MTTLSNIKALVASSLENRAFFLDKFRIEATWEDSCNLTFSSSLSVKNCAGEVGTGCKNQGRDPCQELLFPTRFGEVD